MILSSNNGDWPGYDPLPSHFICVFGSDGAPGIRECIHQSKPNSKNATPNIALETDAGMWKAEFKNNHTIISPIEQTINIFESSSLILEE